MSSPDFKDYLREYEAEGVGVLLYGLVLDMVRQTVVHYPPEVYSPNQVWDEDAITSLCHDFFLEKLLGYGWLEHHLLAQETTVGLSRVLKRDFRHFLINRKRRTEYLNLFSRVKGLLGNDSRFQSYGTYRGSGASIWGLAHWGNKEVSQHLDEVLEAMFTVELPPLIRYRADSKKCSHLLGNNDLVHLLESTLRTVDKHISLSLLMEGLRYRLGLLEAGAISLDEPVGRQDGSNERTYADFVSDSVNPETTLTSVQIAEDIFERLTDRQRRVLAFRLSLADPTLERIGEYVGVSKSTVHNDLAAVIEYVEATHATQEEAEEVLLYLSEICTAYLERTDGN